MPTDLTQAESHRVTEEQIQQVLPVAETHLAHPDFSIPLGDTEPRYEAEDSNTLEPELTDEFQYMPPGVHTLHAFQRGKPQQMEVTVNEDSARALQIYIEQARQLAENGIGDMPFFDFNHEDSAAAAWPVSFVWGGEDPKEGGIRVRVVWSQAGRQAVEGQTYRRFSPVFRIDRQGRIQGADINMGGLVNRAAFESIQPIAAKQVGDNTLHDATDRLNRLIELLAEHGLITSQESEGESLFMILDQRIEALLTPRGAQANENETDSTAAIAAKRVVEQAVSAGRLPPRDTASQAFWQRAIATFGDEAEAILARQSVPSPFEPVVTRGNVGTTTAPVPADRGSEQRQMLDTMRESYPEESFDQIFERARTARPRLFGE